MESTAASHERKKSRLATALKRNMARRKAVLHEVPLVATPPVSAAEIFVDDMDDTTSPMGCCGGCR